MIFFRMCIHQQSIVLRGTRACIRSVPEVPHEKLLGGFNEKLGREDIFKPTFGNKSLYESSFDDGAE
jgi:hypothetical protein